MSSSRCRSVILAIAIILLANASAWSQVLVYRFEFSEEKGVNYHTFETGYFVAPVLGGTGSFILATDEDRSYVTAADSGQLFPAGDRDVRKSVVSANTVKGSAKGQLVVIGDVDHVLKVNSPSVSLSVSVAKVLRGTAVFADNEANAAKGTVETTYGSAGASEAKLTLDEGETERANDDGLSVSATIERLTKQIESEGYAPFEDDGEEEPDQAEGDKEQTPATSKGK